jgi:hydroxymethylglutaryl-CoA lyase
MADNSTVFSRINKLAGTAYPVLAPNLKGYYAAKEVGAKEIAIFGAASEAFSMKNINCSIDDSLSRFKEVNFFIHPRYVTLRVGTRSKSVDMFLACLVVPTKATWSQRPCSE